MAIRKALFDGFAACLPHRASELPPPLDEEELSTPCHYVFSSGLRTESLPPKPDLRGIGSRRCSAGINSIADSVADLGRPDEIGKVFAGFPKYLYQPRAAA